MTSPTGSPAAASERAVALDALRGIALFGVLMVNLVTAFRVSLFEQFLPRLGPDRSTAADRVVASIVTNGLESKAFILFSLLFGVGLAAQQERALARGASFGTYVARRLGMLLAIGLAHLFLVWNGDILTLYALIGLLAAPLLRLPSRVLLVLAGLLFVLQVAPLPYPRPFASTEEMQLHVETARLAYGSGTFGEALAFRVHEVAPMAALLVWSAPRTLGLFLLGGCAWRAGIFRPGERRALLVGTAALGLAAGGAATWAVSAGLDLGRLRDVAWTWGAILLALGYGAAVLLAFRSPALAGVLGAFAPLGRMALTSYLTQSVVLSVLFYGWGVGLFGRDGEAKAALLGLVLYGAQVMASAWWLRRHHFGPVEWLWRSFTYGAWQPQRR
ncbi:MAG TPA: DUF418 domain-containing protein [Labilithrix sp.]|nr:DUF418 domain-containing protein [Labilithrix sp.]